MDIKIYYFSVLICLICLINKPEPDHPLRSDLAKEYMTDKNTFNKKAQEHTNQHALKRTTLWRSKLMGVSTKCCVYNNQIDSHPCSPAVAFCCVADELTRVFSVGSQGLIFWWYNLLCFQIHSIFYNSVFRHWVIGFDNVRLIMLYVI